MPCVRSQGNPSHLITQDHSVINNQHLRTPELSRTGVNRNAQLKGPGEFSAASIRSSLQFKQSVRANSFEFDWWRPARAAYLQALSTGRPI